VQTAYTLFCVSSYKPKGKHCRCMTVLSFQPKIVFQGRYDPTQPLTVNTAIASPLLSRFDLVFVLLDNRSEDWDKLVTSYVLDGKDLPSESHPMWSIEKVKTCEYF